MSRIDQIQSYQQQLVDPSLASTASSAASTTSAATPSSAAASTGSSATSAANFAAVLSALQSQDATETDAIDGAGSDASTADSSSLLSGLTGSSLTGGGSLLSTLLADLEGSGSTSGLTGTTGVRPTTPTTGTSSVTDAPAAVQQMVTEANSLIGKPYVWGGGHGGWGEQSGYDCSGFVSAVLHAGGVLSTPQDTETLPSVAGIESGPGQYVTIYDRTDGYAGQPGHVIIDIDGQFYESGGEHGTWGGGGGVEKINRPTDAYLATFNKILHPSGL